jgi:hypothetical protein
MANDNAAPSASIQMKQLVTAKDLAEALKVTEGWVHDHASGRRRPVLPSIKISGVRRPTYRFDPETVQQWLNELAKQ